jgi:sugar lactone lactonase YvrE
MDASGSMTANAKDGIMVDKNGGIWVIVPQKDDVTLIKQKYYMGQIEDVPTLPKNPSAAEQKKYDEFMAKLFDFEKLPNVKKVYDGPYPVPVRKETEKFFREGLPASVMDEIEGVGALFEQR